MRINPEFLRNVWLEMTSVRLIGMPAVLAAIFLLVYLSSQSLYSEAMHNIALILFVVLVYLWGIRLASDAVINEIRDGTWDAQRMSSIGAWSMSWGKLFGSTVYPWYGGLICIVVYLVSSTHTEDNNPLKVASVLIIAGVFAQAIALSTSLIQARRNLVKARTSSAVSLVLGLFVVLPLIQAALDDDISVTWYGTQYDHFLFSLISLTLITAWMVIGIYRQMRAELQMRCTPLVWMIFITYVALYLGGFVDLDNDETAFSVRCFIAFVIFISAAYLTIFFEPKNPVTFRRLFYQLEHNGYWSAFYHVPVWLASLFLVLLSVIVILFDNNSTIQAFDMHKITNLKVFVVASLFFLMRDMMLLLYLNFGEKVKRADSAALVYLSVLYLIIPGIFGLMDMPVVKALFLPISPDFTATDNFFVYSLWSGLAQMVLMFWLLFGRWRSLNRHTDGR